MQVKAIGKERDILSGTQREKESCCLSGRGTNASQSKAVVESASARRYRRSEGGKTVVYLRP